MRCSTLSLVLVLSINALDEFFNIAAPMPAMLLRTLGPSSTKAGMRQAALRQAKRRALMRDDWIRFAVTHTELGHGILPPLLAADHPPAPTRLCQAFWVIDHHVEDYLKHARLRLAG
jgi:hypothetical protein